jgi:hypothetical protein
MDSGKNLIVGISGVGGVELASVIDIPTSTDASEIIKLIIQVVIGVATLIGLFKKKTPKN